jgi:uncharacterized pyridoxamine 5'-phosphate oxidase family protein
MSEPIEQALEILEEQETCTLATVTEEGNPEAATVRYLHDDDLNIYINTGSTYRKYKNMKQTTSVAIVVDAEYKNLQMEGEATEVFDEKSQEVIDMYIDKYGNSGYLNNEESVFFRIDTNWARVLIDGRFPPEYNMVLGEGNVDPHNAN